jgi:hypothetical protein
MAEKKLRQEIEEIVQELVELKSELQHRFESMKKEYKPVALVILGLIGLKIGLKVSRLVLSLLWRHKFFITAVAFLVLYKFNMIQSRKRGSDFGSM